MGIQRWLVAGVVAWLLGTSPAAAADRTPQAATTTRTVVAVLVHVDRRGKVIGMTPNLALQPALARLLRHTLDQMITRPAHDAHGQPVPSQLVMRLSMRATRLPDGSYNATFEYVSARAIPDGQWVWKLVDQGQRWGLIREDVVANRQALRDGRKRTFMAVSGVQPGQAQAMRRALSQHGSAAHDH